MSPPDVALAGGGEDAAQARSHGGELGPVPGAVTLNNLEPEVGNGYMFVFI